MPERLYHLYSVTVIYVVRDSDSSFIIIFTEESTDQLFEISFLSNKVAPAAQMFPTETDPFQGS